MARDDKEWVEDIISAVTDIRADTAGMDFAAFAAKPVIVRSVLYSIAVIGEAAKNIGPASKANASRHSVAGDCWNPRQDRPRIFPYQYTPRLGCGRR